MAIRGRAKRIEDVVEIRPPEFGMLFSTYQELSRIADDGCEAYAGEAAVYLKSMIRELSNTNGKRWTLPDIVALLPQLTVLCSSPEFPSCFLKTFLPRAWDFIRDELHIARPSESSRKKLLKLISEACRKFAVTSFEKYAVQVGRAIDAMPITKLVKEDVDRFGLDPIPLIDFEGGGPLVLQVIARACFDKFHREDGVPVGDWSGLVKVKDRNLAIDFLFMITHPFVWSSMAHTWDVDYYAVARRKKTFDPLKWWLFTQAFIYQDIDRFNQEYGDGIIRSQKVSDSLRKH